MMSRDGGGEHEASGAVPMDRNPMNLLYEHYIVAVTAPSDAGRCWQC